MPFSSPNPCGTTPEKSCLSRADLREYLLSGCKKESEFMVGVEWEKIGVYRDTAEAIRYSGQRGVEAIFAALISRYRWQAVEEGGHVIALKKGDTSITLEPGGQIELSGNKFSRLDDNARELYSHLTEIREVSEPLGIAWLGIGCQPVSKFEEIEWAPKERYGIMRKVLEGKGSLTFAMMKETASVQISVDYSSEADAVDKFRLAFALSPVLTAVFANSPLTGGKSSGFLSRRALIWRHTAPERTGIIWQVFESGFNFETYIEFALGVPLLFIQRNGSWIEMPGLTFRQYMEKGSGNYRASLEDWELHLSSIFTETRLKTYIEVRSIDCQRTKMGLAAAALLKGLLYDPESLTKAGERLSGLSKDERLSLMADAPVKALRTPFKGVTIQGLAQELVQWSGEGLKRLAGRGLAGANEADYLAPLRVCLAKGFCPAEELLMHLDPRPGGRVLPADRIIAAAAI